MRILIVEDDYSSARYMEGLLARFGECVIARDGQSAVSLFASSLDEGRPFGLLCLDIMMPGKDGHETLQEIRDLEHAQGVKPSDEVKVVMTTALDDVRTVMGAYKKGATAYVVKPISPDRMFDTLRALGIEQI